MPQTLEAAAARLSKALDALEAKVREVKAKASISDDDLFAAPPGRDDELLKAAREASHALEQAANEVRELISARATTPAAGAPEPAEAG